MYRPEYIKALELLARAAAEMEAAGLPKPILVGGAAVEYYTASDIQSGDFDLVEPSQSELEDALLRQGFERPSGPGQLLRGLIHRGLGIGVEIVASSLMDGRADRGRIRLVPIDGIELPVIGIEDLIADRAAQYHASPRGAPDMLGQAAQLLEIAEALENPYDPSYLDRRLREETAGELDLETLRRLVDGDSRK